MPRPSSLSTSVDEGVLEDAARHLYSHLGCLLDLPDELRNTLASVYYEVHWLRRKEGGMPLIAHLPRRRDPEKLLDVAMKQAILRTSQYQIADTLVEGIRQANKDTQPRLYGILVRVTLDKLKWNIENSFEKSQLRRSLEKIGKKPVPEVPGIYERMRQLELSASRPRHRDGVDLSGYIPLEGLPRIGEPVCIVADGEALEGVAAEVWGGNDPGFAIDDGTGDVFRVTVEELRAMEAQVMSLRNVTVELPTSGFRSDD